MATAAAEKTKSTDTAGASPEAVMADAIKRWKEAGQVSIDELNKTLPDDKFNSDQIEEIMAQLTKMGVTIVEDENDDSDNDEEQIGSKDDGFLVNLELNVASLLNHGDTIPCDKNVGCANVIYARRENDDIVYDYYASRDILPGEELLMDYNKFHIKNHTLAWFDEIRNQLVNEEFGFHGLSLS